MTVALPDPLETPGVSQVASSLTCQVHPAAVVSCTLLDPAPAASVTADGVTAKLHAPCCVTLTVMPATVSCAVRGEELVLAATEKLTVAVPDPLETLGVSQLALSLTCHVQPDVVVTVTPLDPAVAASDTVEGVTV